MSRTDSERASRRAAQYQPEIDGLRAVAVLAVVIFHAGYSVAPGGFVGVDVFFVISGFLITRLIANEHQQTGTFRFGRFYFRRLRRLFPALLATTLATFVASFLLLAPPQMTSFGGSAMTTVTSTSNIYFYSVAGYFDDGAVTKPLLHTWSLSVEEQFYLVWPALLIFVVLRKADVQRRIAILAICLVGSLALSQYWVQTNRPAAYFLLPSRIFELSIGAVLALLPGSFCRPRVLRELLSWTGMAMVIYSCVSFSKTTPFPGLSALLPCCGTAMILLGARATGLGTLLSLPPIVAIGKISYSLYLVHWPVTVFFHAYTFRPITGRDGVAIIAASFLLGWLQYRLVEQRFRRVTPATSRRRSLVAALALVICVATPSWVAYSAGGLSWRLPSERRIPGGREARVQQKKRYGQSYAPHLDRSLIPHQNHRGKAHSIYIWGDSHAGHLLPGFSEAFPDHNIYIVYRSGCTAQNGFGGFERQQRTGKKAANGWFRDCARRNRDALAFFGTIPPTTVVLASAKRGRPEEIARASRDIIDRLTAMGHASFVLGDIIRPGKHLAACLSRPAYLISDATLRRQCRGDLSRAAKELEYNKRLNSLLDAFVPIRDIQCPTDECQFLIGGIPLHYDEHHLSIMGSTYIIDRLKARIQPRLQDHASNGVSPR